jgi:hypothetical protein
MDSAASPLLTIHSHHRAPYPSWQTSPDDGRYLGYFENSYGEQWIFEYDYATESGVLRGGDVDWEPHKVGEGGQVPGLNLGREEQAWVYACWLAATAGRESRAKRRSSEH